MRRWRLPRRLRGHSLVEVSIAAGVLVVLLGLAIPVFKSVGDAGEEGSSRLTAQTENHKAPLALASELQNGSTIETNEFGVPRLQILEGKRVPPSAHARFPIPPLLDQAALRCIAVEPDDRLPDCGALRRILQEDWH